ncbi:VPLPA-CTERM sorting domain-containing protein [Algirhabdus cladophorae]|uniref:VPLPA-CTERM sorting domain-containing protein n=1 Tax=Algirhabdus cladophorae TaxID=3377108 RepID=UPI003B849A95
MTLKGLFAGIILSLGTAVAANAASLGYTATDPFVSGEGTVEFTDDGTLGDLLAFGMSVDSASSTLPGSLTEFDFTLDQYTLGMPNDGNATGSFSLYDDLLNEVGSDSVIGIGFVNNVVEIAFNSVEAFLGNGTDVSPAASMVALLEVKFDFGANFSGNPFSELAEMNANGNMEVFAAYKLSAVEMSAVPVPAALPLLLIGVGAFGVVRRRKAVTA